MSATISNDVVLHRELLAIREIAHALIVADRAEDVYKFALDRVTPLLGAQFSMVLRMSDDGELLRPVAQHEWPEPYRAWVGALRVRVGSGPSGIAVQERRVVEIHDLFADEALSDWFDVARELGFRSIVAAPLEGSRGIVGAVTFYFAHETDVTDEQRSLVRLVADQLAAAADKASLIDSLRRTNAALAEANAQLEHLASDAEAARITRDRFHDDVMRTVSALLSEKSHSSHQRAALIARCAIGTGNVATQVVVTDADARSPLQAIVSRCRSAFPEVPIHVDEPTVMLPSVSADPTRIEDVLELVVTVAAQEAHVHRDSVRISINVDRGFVAYRAQWPAAGVAIQPATELTVARQLAQQLGGALHVGDSNDQDASTPPLHHVTFVAPVAFSE